LTLIPLLDAKREAKPEIDASVSALLAFMKNRLGEAVSDVRPSDRLTDSATCLVAPEHGPDRQLERLLAGAGRLKTTAKPILEVNPRHEVVALISSLTDEDEVLKEDAAHLLFEEARIFDGERPDDPRAFSDRIARVLKRALAMKGSRKEPS
jgi:molecular chaperone HtpG